MSASKHKVYKTRATCAFCGQVRMVRPKLIAGFTALVCASHGDIEATVLGLEAKDGQSIVITPSVAGFFRGYTVRKLTRKEQAAADRALQLAHAVKNNPSTALQLWSERQSHPDFALDHVLGLGEKLFDALLDSEPDKDRVVSILSTLPGHEEQDCTGGNFDVCLFSSPRFDECEWEYTSSAGNRFGISGNPSVFIPILACGLVSGGDIVVRVILDETDPVTGFSKSVLTAYGTIEGTVFELSEAKVFSTFCTDQDDGSPIPPEPSTQYRASPVLKFFPYRSHV